MEEEKIGFFKRIKIAIFNIEKYSIFTKEKFSKALKYLFLVITIVTVVLAISSTIELSNKASKFINYLKSDEFTNFSLKDGNLDSDRSLNAYDEEYNSRLIIDTTENISDEKIEEYKKETRDANVSVILLKDKVIYKFDNNTNDGFETNYNNITSMLGINEVNRDKIINDYLNNDNLFKIKAILFIYAFITIFLLNILTLFEDIIIIGLFGWITGKIIKVPLKLSKAISLGIYSLTLSIIINTIYSICYSFMNFEIKYFEIMYMIIAYIYIVAAVFLMKDFDKTAGEVVTVEGQVVKSEKEYSEEEVENKEIPDNKDSDKEESTKENDNGKLEEKE